MLGGRDVADAAIRPVQVGPPVRRADAEPRVLARHARELVDVARVGDDVPHPAARDAVAQIGGPDGRRRRHDDRAELHDGEHEIPQFDLVAEHEDDRVTAPHALLCEPRGDGVGAARHLVVRHLERRAVLLDDDDGCAVVAARDGVEPVDRPVESFADVGPGERREGVGVTPAQLEQRITGGAVGPGGGDVEGGGRHEATLPNATRVTARYV